MTTPLEIAAADPGQAFVPDPCPSWVYLPGCQAKGGTAKDGAKADAEETRAAEAAGDDAADAKAAAEDPGSGA